MKNIKVSFVNRYYFRFKNIGNTCFMSSALQLITNCSQFVERILESNLQNGNCYALASVLRARNKGSDQEVTDCLNMLLAVFKINADPNWQVKNRQQDSSEFLARLLQNIQFEFEAAGLIDEVSLQFRDQTGQVCSQYN